MIQVVFKPEKAPIVRGESLYRAVFNDELRGQLGPKIATVRSKREKNRIATAESRKDPEVARKHREYGLRYNKTRRLELARERAERKLAEIEESMEGM